MEEEEFSRLTSEEKHRRFQDAIDNYNKGFIEEDYVIKSVASVRVEDAMEDVSSVHQP